MRSIVDENNFNVSNGFYVIKFWATWCQPCKVFAPKISSLEEEFKNVEFLSVDIDQVSALAKKYKIRCLPTLLLIENGNEVDRIEGLQLISPIRKKIRSLIANKTQEEEVYPIDKISVG